MACKVGVCQFVVGKFHIWFAARLRQVFFPSLALAVNMATLVYLGLLTPRVPAIGGWPSKAQLPTVLLGLTNICDFLGRLSMNQILLCFPGIADRFLMLLSLGFLCLRC